MFKVHANKDFLAAVRLVGQWPDRTAKLQARVAYTAAAVTYEDLLRRIPKTDANAGYRQSLEVVDVGGLPVGVAAYAIQANPKERKIKKVDLFRTVLYIRARRRLGKVKPEIEVLEQYNPWTPDTLPFAPSRKDATTISRMVSKREAMAVAEMRRRQRGQWRKKLDEVGVREIRKGTRLEVPQKVSSLPDVAFEALRMEFGLGGVSPTPHWRPALLKFSSSGIAELMRDPTLLMAETKLSYTGWKMWPGRVRKRILSSTARAFIPFQTKLGVRAD